MGGHEVKIAQVSDKGTFNIFQLTFTFSSSCVNILKLVLHLEMRTTIRPRAIPDHSFN